MIINKLVLIQQELKAPKGQFNAFGKYKYRSCEDILESVKPLLSKHDCALTLSDDLVNIGSRYYIKATARLFAEKEVTEVTAFAREEEVKKGMDGSQITGASSSYARKYALNGLFAIDDTKDSDGTNTHDKTETDKQRENIPEPLDINKEKEIKKCTTLKQLESLYNNMPEDERITYKKVFSSVKAMINDAEKKEK